MLYIAPSLRVVCGASPCLSYRLGQSRVDNLQRDWSRDQLAHPWRNEPHMTSAALSLSCGGRDGPKASHPRPVSVVRQGHDGFTSPAIRATHPRSRAAFFVFTPTGTRSAMELASLGPATVLCESLIYCSTFLAIAVTNLQATALADGKRAEAQKVS